MDAGVTRRRAALLFLALGSLAFGFAPILVRVCRYPSPAVASLRILIAGLLLLPLAAPPAARLLRGGGANAAGLPAEPGWASPGWRAVLLLGLPGLLLGLHFQLWVLGIRLTSVATGTFLFSINPVLFALVERLVDRSRIPARTTAALLLAVAGAGWTFWREGGRIGRIGDLYCLLSVLFFVAYLVISRTASRGIPHRVYVCLLYLGGGLLTLPFLLLPADPGAVRLSDTGSLLALLGLALFPTLIGHTSANYGVRILSPLTVSFFTLLEPVFATAAAASLLGESPRVEVLPAYLLFVAATVLVLLPCGGGSRRRF